MRKILLAIAAAVLASTIVNAKPHQQITDEQLEHCLKTGSDPDGTEWCIKYNYGMTTEEQDAWYVEERKRIAAKWQADAPAREAGRKAFDAKVNHALNSEIMAQCNRMSDTPAIDWAEVAAFRGVTVSINDCAKAAAGLAAEYEK